ncbi:MAG: citrate/2-methylcitrate synthase [Bacillota bacterium]|jgi:citrate synthase
MGKNESRELLRSLGAVYTSHNHLDPQYFEKYKVKRGLRNADGTGVVAGLTLIGNVHGYLLNEGEKMPIEGQLTYRGIDVREIVAGCAAENRFGFEEVAFLLLFGCLPTQRQLDDFITLLGYLRKLPENFTEDMLIKAPSKDIMNKLAQATLALYSYDANPDDTSLENVLRQCMELIARFPIIVAHAYQVKKRYYDQKSMYIHFPKENLATAENFLRMIRSDKNYSKAEARLLDLALILHAEHGGGNNSAFAARVLSSAGTDTYSATAAAVGSLKGPKHGGANSKVVAMFEDIKAHVQNWQSDVEIRSYLEKIIKKEAGDGSGLVYGMGHAIYTLSDPRAALLKENAKTLAAEKGMLDEFLLIDAVERLTPEIFANIKGDAKVMCANVDLYSGFVYRMLNIPQELFTTLFAISRIVGWSAHRIEEIATGGRIIRPAYKSIAPVSQYITISER